jgi:CRP-like cAMP-binding protein
MVWSISQIDRFLMKTGWLWSSELGSKETFCIVDGEKLFDQPKALSLSPLFIGFSNNQLETLIASAVNKRYRRGETVFSEGEEGRGLFVVLDGRIKVFKVSAEGKELIINIFGRGEPFGEAAIFLKKSHLATTRSPLRLISVAMAFFESSG